MTPDSQLERVLRLYPDDCQPQAIEPFESAQSFSGAGLWRVSSPRGTLCLRQWPPDHPSPQRLEFIQAVLWHTEQEGFHLAPLPLETRHRHGYVRHAGSLWELMPWLPGAADYRERPSPERLQNALTALAIFHEKSGSFPLPDNGPAYSPGMIQRRSRLGELISFRAAELHGAIGDSPWPELCDRARRLVSLFERTAPKVLPLVEAATQLRVGVQPCIRDIWQAHVLFVGELVSGIVDFGSMRPDNVATDVARLLGSLAGDDAAAWQQGLAAYQTVRRLSADELALVRAFDRSTVLMGGMQWLEWIYLEKRTFANRAAVLERVDEFVARLTTLSQSLA